MACRIARDFSNKSIGQSVKDRFSDNAEITFLNLCIVVIQHPKKASKQGYNKKDSDCTKDTSFNIGTNNVSIDIKVDSDEFSLEGRKANVEIM